MVYVFLADGFEEIEAIAPIDILRRGGIDVKTVGVGGKIAVGAHGIPVACDITAEQLELAELSAVVLPGGMPGTLNLEKSTVVKQAVKHAFKNGGVIGAICAAPSVLGHMGLLNGKKATCFPGFEGELNGAEFINQPVVKDGNIITSRGAGTAIEFGVFLLGAVNCDDDAARALAESMMYSNGRWKNNG